MKKKNIYPNILITIFTFLLWSLTLNAQTTAIPDANFEQALIWEGLDVGPVDGSVPTANIDTVTFLYVFDESISDLTGIQDFTALVDLDCSYNNLTNLVVSQNPVLKYLDCEENQLIGLNLSQNTSLVALTCYNNQLTCLNLKNGNNINIFLIWADNNSNLSCVEVDDPLWATANWANTVGLFDPQISFSSICNNPCYFMGIEDRNPLFNIYPNPVSNYLAVETEHPTQLALYNVQGKLVMGKEITSTHTLNTSELSKGIYLLKVTNEQGRIYSKKIIKK